MPDALLGLVEFAAWAYVAAHALDAAGRAYVKRRLRGRP